MDRRYGSVPVRPLRGSRLSHHASGRSSRALSDRPEVLDDLRGVLTQLSPGVRSALVANLTEALASEGAPDA